MARVITSRRRTLSVRQGVFLALLLLCVIAVSMLLVNLQALASAAFMLERAEISNRQLSAYQQLSIDLLEYIRVSTSSTRVVANRASVVHADLESLDASVKLEVGLVHDNGGNESDDVESRRLLRIHAAVERFLATPSASNAGVYEDEVRPMLVEAVLGERSEVAGVAQSMAALQGSMRVTGPIGVLLQLSTAGIVVVLVGRLVFDPLSRLVADMRLLGRGSLAHRVDVERHDEFGLLALHINRMARSLDRGRRLLLASNENLETTVLERTQTLSERNAELKEIDESRRRFFADVSHELRTPLTAIVGEADVTLRIADRLVEPYRDALGSILANSTYLNRRIDDLMALARSLDGRLELDRRSVALEQVVNEAMKEIGSLARINDVRIRVDVCEETLVVRGDHARLRQCLMVLLDNAIKFSRGSDTITVALAQERSHVTVSVIDEGGGIPTEDLSYVFERFYQSEVGKRMGGTGLGLAIARRIADAHDGTIEAFRNERGGTRVTLSLPLEEKAEA